jgi:hypothetical protein
MNELLKYNLQFFAEEGAEHQENEPEKKEPTKVEQQEKKEPETTDMQELLNRIATLERKADKASAEAADYKKKWKESLSSQEQASIEKAEKEAEREEKFNQLLRENSINKLEKTYLGLGYLAEEAEKMAAAEFDGDLETKTKIMREVDARKKKEFEAEFLKSRPEINAGAGGESPNVSKEAFEKMGYLERVEFKNKYPETYKKFTNK